MPNCLICMMMVVCVANILWFGQASAQEGQWYAIDVDDAKVKEMTQSGVDLLNRQSSSSFYQPLVRILKAESQVVYGTNYAIHLIIGQSKCRNEQSAKLSCKPTDNSGQEYLLKIQKYPNELLSSPELINLSAVNATQELISQLHKKASDQQAIAAFKHYALAFNKVYSSLEEVNERFGLYTRNMARAAVLQAQDQATGIYGETKMTDRSEQEMKRYLGEFEAPIVSSSMSNNKSRNSDQVIPEAFDWRDHGVVGPVKNQENCGACWSFGLVGNIESQLAKKFGNYVALSEQEVLDCSADMSCGGGSSFNAAQQLIQSGRSVVDGSEYPYVAEKRDCRTIQGAKTAVKVNAVWKVANNEADMARELATEGPLTVRVCSEVFNHYVSGISHPNLPDCEIHHSVIVVAYGIENTIPYWVLRNTWGSSFGESGYMRLFRGADCIEITNLPFYVTVA